MLIMSKVMRVKFEKTGDMIYISHLDVQRLLQRAFRRAEIELSFSQGFNPHPKMSYGNALALGVESYGEYVDIEIEDNISPQDMLDRMNEKLPDGMKFIKCIELAGGERALAPNIVYGDYEFVVPNAGLSCEKVQEYVDNIISAKEILTTKLNKKKKVVELDIRPMIKSIELESVNDSEIVIKAILVTGSKQNLNTNVFIPKLLEFLQLDIDSLDVDIYRKDLYFEIDDELVVPF